MAKNNYTEDGVLRHFRRIKDVDINTNSKIIFIIRNTTNLGNGSYGKIAYLEKVHGYKIAYVDKLTKRSKVISETKEREDNTEHYRRHIKRDKINMVAMTKDAMKKNKR